MKIVIITTASSTVINFRKDLILRLKEEGNDVVIIANDEDYKEEIMLIGTKFYNVNVQNRSKNVFKNLSYYKKVKKIIRRETPNLVFTFQLKPNTLGVLASNRNTPTIFSMVEGLGDVFIKKGLIWVGVRIIVKYLYKQAFRKVDKAFFLNQEDMNFFVEKKIIQRQKSIVIPGVGINTNYFPYSPVVSYNTFVMVARLMKSKGVREYCEAAKLLKKQGLDYDFLLVGAPGDIKMKEINKYIKSKYVTYLGYRKDVKSIINQSTVFVLPSYREGLPISILEAMSIGRAIITTNAIGCKDTVVSGINGYLVNIGDPYDLANNMMKLIKNKNTVDTFGKKSRVIVEQKFEQSIINSIIVREITNYQKRKLKSVLYGHE